MAHQSDSDDYNPRGEHVFEIPAHETPAVGARRRSIATLGLAVFIALTGTLITVGIIGDQARRTSTEAAQQEELRVGWQMLGALAADGAAREPETVSLPPTSTPSAPTPNIVIVNVPGQTTATNASPGNGNAIPPAANAPLPAAAPALPGGAFAQPLPSGSVPASSPVQSLPESSVPTPSAFPASQLCGLTTCDSGSVCCNSVCGICTAPGATCAQSCG